MDASKPLSKNSVEAVHLVRNKLENYWKEVKDFHLLLYTVLHILCGSPARATEESLWKFSNITESMRNMFIYSRKLMFLSAYNKTSGVSGSHKHIPRVVPDQLAPVVLIYVFFIKTLLQAFGRTATVGLSSQKIHNLSHYFHSTPEGNLMTSGELTRGFRFTMQTHFATELTFAQYRQVL